jgi:hypothetical protein
MTTAAVAGHTETNHWGQPCTRYISLANPLASRYTMVRLSDLSRVIPGAFPLVNETGCLWVHQTGYWFVQMSGYTSVVANTVWRNVSEYIMPQIMIYYFVIAIPNTLTAPTVLSTS